MFLYCSWLDGSPFSCHNFFPSNTSRIGIPDGIYVAHSMMMAEEGKSGSANASHCNFHHTNVLKKNITTDFSSKRDKGKQLLLM